MYIPGKLKYISICCLELFQNTVGNHIYDIIMVRDHGTCNCIMTVRSCHAVYLRSFDCDNLVFLNLYSVLNNYQFMKILIYIWYFVQKKKKIVYSRHAKIKSDFMQLPDSHSSINHSCYDYVFGYVKYFLLDGLHHMC